MSYTYAAEKPKLFTDEGQKEFLKGRDWVQAIMAKAGAFRMGSFLMNAGCSGNDWEKMAIVDRMVELGELREIRQDQPAGQHRIFVKF